MLYIAKFLPAENVEIIVIMTKTNHVIIFLFFNEI